MTGPATADSGDAVESLSRLVANNEHLVTRPGLVLALQQSNATPQQAQAVNQFVGSLNAAVKVRNATAAGVQIDLSPTEQQQLDGMNVDYSHVVKNVYNPLTALQKQLAAEGLQPKLAADQTSIITDSQGNPHTEPLRPGTDYGKVVGASVTQPSLLGARTMTPGEQVSLKNAQLASAKQAAQNQDPHGFLDSVIGDITTGITSAAEPLTRGARDISSGLTKSWNFIDSVASQSREQATNPGGYARASSQNAEAMQQLGYDPNSWVSTMAFNAQGYASNDTSGAANAWDAAHPNGLFGMNGKDAAVEAQVFLTDPQGYEQKIVNSGTPEQAADRMKMLNSSAFQKLVKRVSADRNSIGNDVARELNIDPVKHSTLHALTAFTADTAASFVLDPTAQALYAYTGIQHASVAIKNFDDAENITRVLYAGNGGEYAEHATAAQLGKQRSLRDMVRIGSDYRAANAANDPVKMAQAQAHANANQIGGLLSDFAGEDQILRWKTPAEIQAEADRGVKDPTPFITGKGDPVDTYDKAVEYVASKAAFFRLGGGKAPIEFSTMPGAVSSYAYTRLKGSLSAWQTGIGVRSGAKAAAAVVAKAEADPEVARALLTEGSLRRVLPSQDDAMELLTGRVIAAKADAAAARRNLALRARQANPSQEGITGDRAAVESGEADLASAQRALAERQMQLEGEGSLEVTPEGMGRIRGNRLRYGTATKGKLSSIYTLGALQRAGLIVTRLTNQLPRDLAVDVTRPADAESIRRLARTYLTKADANLLAARWTGGTAETRKAIVQALREQVYHAAGLSRSRAGREFLDNQGSLEERYSINGVEWKDSFGRNAGQFPGQMQTEFRLPNFGRVHKVASKVGLYEGTMGRFFQTNAMERLNSLWRTGILGTPITAWRAVLESLLVAHINPELGIVKSLAAKAVMREEGLLSVKGLHRSWAAEAIANTVGFRDVGRLYRNLLKRSLSDQELEALRTMPKERALERMAQQTRNHWAQEVDPSNAGDATDIAEAGLNPTRVTYDTSDGFDAILRKRQGYELTEEVDGAAGANAYAFSLGSRVNASPRVAKAILDRIEGNGHLHQVVDALDNERLMNDSLYGKVFRDPSGMQHTALTPGEKTLGKQQWAQQLVDDVTHLMVGRNGRYQHSIADYIREHGHSPSADWLQDNVKGMDRPGQMLRPQYAAVIPGLEGASKQEVLNQIAESLQSANGKIYQWAVERLIQRNSTTPLYSLAYAKSKVSLQGLKDAYMEAGLAEPAAESVVANIADSQAWNRVAMMVDDPSLKLQMDVVGRSFFAFSRATTMMLRRWGVNLWKNPAQARRLMLTYEGAEHSGFIYKDQNGQPMFLLPLSGVAQQVFLHAVSHIPGFEGAAMVPTSDFEGNVASIIPGSNNPLQYNTTPFVSIAGRWLGDMLPDTRELIDEVDQKLNGTAGQGQSVAATLEPRLLKGFLDADGPILGPNMGGEGRNSVVNSAMVGSLYYMYAAGQVPPENASPAEYQKFYDNLKTGTRNVLFARFLLGTISPARISVPGDTSKPDFSYAVRGVKSMKDEFAQLINDTGGNWARALAIWTGMHPDETVYTQAESQGLVKNTLLPATQKAYQWMLDNRDLVHKYGSLSAYFMPEQKPGDAFSMEAYRAQLELGFRERKTPQEFLDGVRIAGAGATYYAMQDAKDAQLAQAQKANDTTLQENIRKGWSIWSTQFKNQHPIFKQHQTEAASASAPAMGQYRDLQQMVAANEVPGSASQKQLVGSMVQTFDSYQHEMSKYPTNTRGDTSAKAAMTAAMTQFFDQMLKADPSLIDLYNAVIRPLNERLQYVQSPDGS